MGEHGERGWQAMVPHFRGAGVHRGACLPHRDRAQLACGQGARLRHVDPKAASSRGDGRPGGVAELAVI
eukprot:6173102-Heterocapsa_arctica.AAC.1